MAEGGNDEGQRKDEQLCTPCLKKNNKCTADVFCGTCNEYQCIDCSSCHSMSNHELVKASDGQYSLASEEIKPVDMKGHDVCKQHDEKVKFYCENHKVLACSTCAFAYHRKCSDVPEFINIAKKGQCGGLKNELKAAITESKSAVGNLNVATERLSTDVSRIPKKLNEMKERFVQIFDEFAHNVTVESVAYRDKSTTTRRESKRKCESRINDMTDAFGVIDEIAENGTECEQFIIHRSMKDSVRKRIEGASAVCSDLHELNISCNFDTHFEQFKSRLTSSMKQAKLEMKRRVMKTTQLEEIASIDLKQMDGDRGKPLYSGLDFLPDGRLMVVDNRNDKCVLYDENLTLKSTYKLPFQYPQSLVVVSDEEIAITSSGNCRLDFLHISKSNQITLNRTCKVNVSYFSISMKDDENFVVSTIDHKIPARIVSLTGAEKKFDIKFPSKKYPLNTSYSTYIRGQDKLVLCDSDADTVYIYDVQTGEKVVIQHDLIKKPRDVAVGPYGHVFVASLSTRSLVEITPAGSVLSSHQVDMKFPCTLAISKDRGRLAVSNVQIGHRQLKMYKIVLV